MPVLMPLPMPPPSRPPWLVSALDQLREARGLARAAESCPPSMLEAHRAWSSRLGRWLGASVWLIASPEPRPMLGHRRRSAALGAARLDFAEALYDVRTSASAELLDRIATTRSLRELWHLRDEVFGHVSRRHGQAEAQARLATLDGHFPRRMRRAGFAARAPMIGAEAAALLRAHRRAANDAQTD
jgi:hypothetical protein